MHIDIPEDECPNYTFTLLLSSLLKGDGINLTGGQYHADALARCPHG